jgi:hypothetical protein
MTVQELFKSLDREDFIKYYCQYEDVLAGKYEVTEKGKKIVTDLFNQLLTVDPVPAKENKNWIIFSIPEAGTISLSSFTVEREELLNPGEDGYVEHYGYEFDPMREILSYEVSKACLQYFNDPRQVAASILYEMTFFGYSVDNQEEEATQLLDSLNEQADEITEALENGDESKLSSFEDVVDHIGWVDTRTEEDKAFEHDISTIEGEFYIKLRDRLYDLERAYLKNK